jgi:hypothetical protein
MLKLQLLQSCVNYKVNNSTFSSLVFRDTDYDTVMNILVFHKGEDASWSIYFGGLL